MPIALFKFPNDLLREVFRLCNPFELYKLSKCSKKSSQKSITLGGTEKWKISYMGNDLMPIRVDDSNYNFYQTDNSEEYFQTNVGRYGNYMGIEFPNGGTVDLFFYLIDTFGIRIVKLLEIFGSIPIFYAVAKVLIDRNMEIEKLEISNTEEVQDVINLMPMLNQMNVTHEFHCFFKFPPNFHFEFVKYPRQIYINYSSWFTINQLFDCTCARIDLGGSSFTNHDLNVFLQKWNKAGTFPNLRCLRIQSFRIDDESPIQEMIPPIQTDNPKIRVSIHNKRFYDDVVDAVRITKDDGTVGWLTVQLGGWPTLKFLVADPADTVVEENPEEDD
ncbi:unnamed protein product [Caenorhabditis nigoni]